MGGHINNDDQQHQQQQQYADNNDVVWTRDRRRRRRRQPAALCGPPTRRRGHLYSYTTAVRKGTPGTSARPSSLPAIFRPSATVRRVFLLQYYRIGLRTAAAVDSAAAVIVVVPVRATRACPSSPFLAAILSHDRGRSCFRMFVRHAGRRHRVAGFHAGPRESVGCSFGRRSSGVPRVVRSVIASDKGVSRKRKKNVENAIGIEGLRATTR